MTCAALTSEGQPCRNDGPYWDLEHQRWTCWHHNSRTVKKKRGAATTLLVAAREKDSLMRREQDLLLKLNAVRKRLRAMGVGTERRAVA